ncbi:MAG: aldo/keto reductase [Chitinophagaceae bacterium]
MEYQHLGNSGLHLSRIGFGCMSLGEDYSETENLILRAVDHGINFFDTADLYQKGQNESFLGGILKGRRDKVIISTKVGNQWRADGQGWDWNPRKEYILDAVNGSLSRLQTDYIDVYQLHGGTLEDPIDETIEAFEMLKKQGKIRFYGISSIRPNVIEEYARRSAMVSVMMQYSLLDRRPQEACLGLLQQNNIGVLARGSIAKGLLVDKAATGYLNYSEPAVRQAAAAIKGISGEQRSAVQTALRFVLRHPAISSAVVGIRTPKQLEEAVQTLNTPLLTDAEYLVLQESLAVNYYDQHR